jgi:hypothetical protein
MPERDFPRARTQLLPRDTALLMLFFKPRQFIKDYRWYLVALLLGASADVFTTLWNLRAYGSGVEMHIVQRWISEIVGVEAGVPLAKLGQLMFVVLVAAWWRPWCRWLLLACGCLYALAAMSTTSYGFDPRTSPRFPFETFSRQVPVLRTLLRHGLRTGSHPLATD